jgi:NCAIR mutase (PurE)-related protein
LSFRPLVLNTNRWSQEPLGLLLPPQLQTCVDLYASWYSSVHASRKLNWVPMGTAEVGYKCGRSYKLVMDNTPQLIYILQFETASTLTPEVIAANTGSTVEQVHRFLAPFASKQIGVLIKNADNYQINTKFKSAKNIIKVPMGARAQATEDKSKTASEISIQRKAQTQAAIVRMMKSFKTLQHNDLIARVLDELQKRFKPDPRDIKKEIAFLIQENYLKRSETALDMYDYVA